MPKIEDKSRKAISTREDALDQDRKEFDSIWKEQREYILPWHGRNLNGEERNEDTEGRLRSSKILDSTATRAIGITAAGMQAGINSPARPWFKLAYADKDLSEFKPVKLWLDQVERIIRDVYARSNIYRMLHHSYLELAAFGTSCANIRPDFESVLRARPYTVGEYWLGLDHNARVDTMMRRFRLTSKQMVTQFGEENVSDAVKSAFKANRTEERFSVTHFIEPNDDRIPFNFSDGKAFRTVYHEKGFPEGKALQISGTEVKPFIAPRWHTVGMMPYGFGPGMSTLTDIKGLQKEKEKQLIAEDKLVDPPLVGPSSLESQVVNTMPGGITYDDSINQAAGLRPLYQVQPDIGAILAGINDTRNAIREGMFTNLFTLIANSVDVSKTATEVAALKEEKLMVLGPVLDNVHNEVHKPLIDIAFHYANKAGLIPEPPEEIQGMEIEVEFISILAQAQKLAETAGIEQVASFVGNLSAIYPEARHKFDATQAIDEYSNAVGVSAGVINSDEEVAAMAAQEQRQAQLNQAMQATASSAQSAKVLSETDVGGGNSALQSLMGTSQ
jgi:hypothetical protein